MLLCDCLNSLCWDTVIQQRDRPFRVEAFELIQEVLAAAHLINPCSLKLDQVLDSVLYQIILIFNFIFYYFLLDFLVLLLDPRVSYE